MNPKLKRVLCVAAVACSAWLAVNIYDNQTIKKGMPPGYYLECDGYGNYRPCQGGRSLYWTRGPGNKAQAIRRAWRQYYYVPRPDPQDIPGDWKPCNDR